MTISRRSVLAALGVSALVPIRAAHAQTFPNRTIRIIVPFPAGGPTDILSRVIAQKMSEDGAAGDGHGKCPDSEVRSISQRPPIRTSESKDTSNFLNLVWLWFRSPHLDSPQA